MAILEPGCNAPDFAITGHAGETVKLSDFAGKFVLLWFFARAGSPDGKAQGRALRDCIKDLADLQTVVLGASFDTVADNRAFAEEQDLPFVLLCDTGRALAIKYCAAADKSAIEPRRISYLIAPDCTIARAFENVVPALHPNLVLRELADLVG